MMLKPLADRVVVRPMEQEETTSSGIVLPDTAKEKPQQGKVLAVGPGRVENGQKIAVEVKVDDVVLFPQYGGTKVKVDGEELLVIKESELLAVVE